MIVILILKNIILLLKNIILILKNILLLLKNIILILMIHNCLRKNADCFIKSGKSDDKIVGFNPIHACFPIAVEFVNAQQLELIARFFDVGRVKAVE